MFLYGSLELEFFLLFENFLVDWGGERERERGGGRGSDERERGEGERERVMRRWGK